jgi:Dehydratase medium subunit
VSVQTYVYAAVTVADRQAVAAGFEEEAVPVRIGAPREAGGAAAIAWAAALRSPLRIGIGGDAHEIAIGLVGSRTPYLIAPRHQAREIAQKAARLAARRPLSTQGLR